MNRKQQTIWIVAAIIASGVVIAWAVQPVTDFTRMHWSKACEYSAFSRDHGGGVEACKAEFRDAWVHRMNDEPSGTRDPGHPAEEVSAKR